MSTAGSFPVFGSGGRLEGDLTKEQAQTSPTLPHETKLQPLRPTMEYRDPARDAEALDRQFHAQMMQNHPELATAQDERRQAQTTVQQWTEACYQQEAAVVRLRNMVLRGSVEYEDPEPGSRGDRLRAAEAQLAESHLELQAAAEELELAEQKVKSIMKAVTP
jgi:hypothetical protein